MTPSYQIFKRGKVALGLGLMGAASGFCGGYAGHWWTAAGLASVALTAAVVDCACSRPVRPWGNLRIADRLSAREVGPARQAARMVLAVGVAMGVGTMVGVVSEKVLTKEPPAVEIGK